MTQLKPAYLIHGDDHGAIAERRAGLRALVEGQPGGAVSLELLEGEQATPAGAGQALARMTLTVGQRVIIVEGAERWREQEVERDLSPAMGAMPPQTTLAVFAREEPRAKAPAALHEAVRRAGGQVVAHMTVRPWELHKWVREQAARLGLAPDADAVRALLAQVGERQQRLLRELEKLALAQPAGNARTPTPLGAADVERLTARSVEWRAYGLADALVSGDGRGATLAYLRLREQGERLSGLTYLMAARLRDALALALRLRAGETPPQAKRSLRMPARAAERFLAAVSKAEPERLREALATLAELEVDSRGGAPIPASRNPQAGLGEDTIALRAIERVAR